MVAQSKPAAVVQGLTKTYRRFRQDPVYALKAVDLQLEAGTAFGLIGPNGAGKTTLIKTLLGIVQPTAGTIEVLGYTPTNPKSRRRVGYLPERLTLPPAWSPRQFLRSVARFKSVPEAEAQIDALLHEVELGDVDRHVGKFSKGMKQRLGLAGALLGEPDLLVLDEPTDGIDPVGRKHIRDLLVRAKEAGTTIILNSHLLSETERICDRIGILHQGQLAREGSLAELALDAARWRARFEQADPQRLAQDGWQFEDPFYTIAADSPETLDQHLAAARAHGALLVALEPATRSLEEIFTLAVQEGLPS